MDFHFISALLFSFYGCSPLSSSRSAVQEKDLWSCNNSLIASPIQSTEKFAQVAPKLSSNRELHMSAPKSKTVQSALAIGMYVQLEAWIVKKKKYLLLV